MVNTKLECYICNHLVLTTKGQVKNFRLKNLGCDPKESDNSDEIKIIFFNVDRHMHGIQTINFRRRVTDIWKEICKKKKIVRQCSRNIYIWLSLLFSMFNSCTEEKNYKQCYDLYIFLFDRQVAFFNL